jgi:hypothetical protein
MFRLFRRAREKAVSEKNFMRFLRYATGEIFLVVIGILIALQINNWNEERQEQRQIAEYARALIVDLKADLVMLETVLRTASRTVNGAKDLATYLRGRRVEDVDNLHLAYLTEFNGYRPYSWNRSALQQLINSGALRQMKNIELVRMISEYDASARHLDEDYREDMEDSREAEALAFEIVDSNYPDPDRFTELTWRRPYAFPPTELLEAYGDVRLDLITQDSRKIRSLVNHFSSLGGQIRIRVEMELPDHLERARQLIELLELEYPQ